MAKRKRVNMLKELIGSPWWAGVAVGVGGYFLLASLVPWLTEGEPLLRGVGVVISQFAPLWLIICLGAAVASLAGKLFRRRLYDRTGNADDVAGLSWQRFEQLVGEYFRRHGFTVRETGSAGGDGGVDLLLFRKGERHVVQCKHWKARQVGVGVVRELIGTVQLTGAVSGFLVTSGQITEAAAEAARNGDVRILSGPEILRAGKGEKAADDSRSGDAWLRFLYRLVLLKGLVGLMLILGGLAVVTWLPGHLARAVQSAVIGAGDKVTTGPVSQPDDPGGESAHNESRKPPGESGNSARLFVPDGIYRWRDEEGTVTYGDSPPEGVEYERLRGKMDERNVVKSYGD